MDVTWSFFKLSFISWTLRSDRIQSSWEKYNSSGLVLICQTNWSKCCNILFTCILNKSSAWTYRNIQPAASHRNTIPRHKRYVCKCDSIKMCSNVFKWGLTKWSQICLNVIQPNGLKCTFQNTVESEPEAHYNGSVK